MTDEKILQKAIEKAVKNGFTHEQLLTENSELLALDLFASYNEYFLIFNHDFAKAFFGTGVLKISCGSIWCDGEKIANNLEDLQNSINAVDEGQLNTLKKYGQVMVSDYCIFKMNPDIYIGDWKYHLQQMVLEKEPLKYLEKFLEE